MTIAAIDFARLYRDHMALSGKPKPNSAWDARAASMNRQVNRGRYVDEFISRMNLSDARTLLDVGCGPGTLCLPLAARFERVIALDYSQGMLNELKKNVAAQGITNIEPLHLAWEDDWSEVPECDIVIASRSTMVQDLGDALAKLNAKAKKRVYLTYLVGGNLINQKIFAALGREPTPAPDYIYALNILHRRGIHPRLDYIEDEGPLSGITDFDELLQRLIWSLGELNADERASLHTWFDAAMASGGLKTARRWAFISWEK